MKFEDLSNYKFGKLKVIKRVDDYVSPKGYHQVQWECLCDCGNIVYLTTSHLKSEHTKSCGCLRKEVAFKNWHNEKNNKYEIYDTYVIMYTSKMEPFYIDIEDFDKVKNICWYKNSSNYLVGKNNGKYVQLHRIVMNCPKDMMVDHIGGESTKHDNRKNNLRLVNCQQNNMNNKIYSNNTSGVTGVSYVKSSNKWAAYINYKGECKHLGTYDSFEDAVKARKTAEEKHFKEYSYENSQKRYLSTVAE